MFVRSKWGNKKVEYAGRKFDSKIECERFKFLEILASKSIIDNLGCQYPVTLMEAFKTKTNRHFRPMVYKADFIYTIPHLDDMVILEDVKGFETPEFKLKRKILEKKLLQEEHTYFITTKKADEEIRDPREPVGVVPKKRRTRKKSISV